MHYARPYGDMCLSLKHRLTTVQDGARSEGANLELWGSESLKVVGNRSMTRPSKAKSIELLTKALDVIPELKPSRGSQEFQKWRRDTQVTIREIFVERPEYVQEFDNVNYTLQVYSSGILDSEFQRAYEGGLDSAGAKLESMIDEIKTWWTDDETPAPAAGIQKNNRPKTNEVFIVHGRDDGTKNTVARFLESLGLEPVILAEQPSQGRTIIEKFEQHAQVEFAIALMTPDDAGSFQGDENNLSPRARQNVIFELGFFIGRLDRKGVCAVTKGDVEIPSDYAGVVYIQLDDSDGWKLKLIKELKSVGYDIDANKAIAK